MINSITQRKEANMNQTYQQSEKLASLFNYPNESFVQSVNAVQTYLNENYPEAAEELARFTSFVSAPSTTFAQLEELYARTFEVQAITTLDIGYVLFGDDYKRGALLVNLNREHREAGVDCGNELADHLPNVLRLLARMSDAELREELVQKIVAPALRKIISEFDPEKMRQKNAIYQKHHKTLIERSARHGTIYQYPLTALYRVLEADFDLKEFGSLPVPGAEFLKSIGSEMSIES